MKRDVSDKGTRVRKLLRLSAPLECTYSVVLPYSRYDICCHCSFSLLLSPMTKNSSK